MASVLEMFHPRNLELARAAKKQGMQNSLRIIYEARRAGLPLALAFALVEKESSIGSNVFGHDPTSSIPNTWKGTVVTKEKYRYYRARRSRYGMQGVGPLQLTWWETQDKADRLGGCHIPRVNIRVGFQTLAALIRAFGKSDGIRRYNGSGPAAYAYARRVLELEAQWQRRLPN